MLSLISSAASAGAHHAPTPTGWAALSSVAVIPTVLWALASGSVAAWIGHRYRNAPDDEDVAQLSDATCPRCGHVITLSEAAPGRSAACVACHRRLPFSWIATQLAVLVGCLGMLMTFGPQAALLPFLWLVPVLVTASVVDLRTMLIPKRVVYVGFAVGLLSIAAIALWRGVPDTLVPALACSAAYVGVLGLMWFIMPAGMGFGDVRLAAVLGLYLGWIDWRLVIFGLFISNVVHVVWAGPARLRGVKYQPFGPALAMGTLLAIAFFPNLLAI